MGNTQAIYPYSVTDLKSIGVDYLQKVEDQVFRKIWRSSILGEECQEYSIFTTSNRTPSQQIEIYEKRRQQEAGLVRIHYVENTIGRQHSNTSYKQFKVFTQRIPITLDDISHLPLNSALYLLQKIFSSFSILFKQVGYFDVYQKLIGIDLHNQPKVWFNSCWASNQISAKSKASGNYVNLQGLMVSKLFGLVENHIKDEQLINYKQEKGKIQSWTFQLAVAFIQYFVKGERIFLPCRVIFSRKSEKKQSNNNKNTAIRKQFSIKDPYTPKNISSEMNNQSSFPVSRQNIAQKHLFDSVHLKSQTHRQTLNFKPANAVNNQKNVNQVPSPKSIGGKSFTGITGLDFKQNSIIKQQRKDNYDKQVTKSTCLINNSDSSPFDFGQRKFRLTTGRVFDLKSQREPSQKGFQFDIGRSFCQKNENSSSKSSNKRQNKREHSTIQKRFQTQSNISIKDKDQFKDTLDNRRIGERSSYIQPSKNQYHIDFNFMTQNQFYNTTHESNGFYSPMIKPKSHLIKNNLISSKAGLVFSQQINYKTTSFDQAMSKTPDTASPVLYGKSKQSKQFKQSEIIAQSNEQITQFPEICQLPKRMKTFMSQSITLEQPMIQSKKNQKVVSMLDMLITKKTIQKMGLVCPQNFQQIDMKNHNILAQSIIEPYIGQ